MKTKTTSKKSTAEMQPASPKTAPVRRSSKTGRLDIRVTAEARHILQQAAQERHTTISQFVLESALTSAGNVLAERSQFMLSAQQWELFLAALDAPPRPHPRMERLLNKPSLLD
jgi:uncharacterized protein (DUF1778 family)